MLVWNSKCRFWGVQFQHLTWSLTLIPKNGYGMSWLGSITSGVYKRNIFQRGQSQFYWFYEIWFFTVKIAHFGRPQTNFSGFKKWQQQQQKGPLLIFIPFPFHFQFSSSSLSNLPSFLLHFPFLPCLFFPGRSAKMAVQVSFIWLGYMYLSEDSIQDKQKTKKKI